MGSPKSSGSATSNTTTSNKTADTLLPYTTSGLDDAKQIYSNNKDNSTLYDWLNGGYKDLFDTSTSDSTKKTSDNATDNLNYGLEGGYSVKNSPANGTLDDLTLGGTDSQGTLSDLSLGSGTNQKKQSYVGDDLYSLAKTDNKDYTTGTGELSKEANGDYLNSNPYLDDMYGTSAKQVGDYYQTYTAPNTDSTYETAGRYGSGSAKSAQSQNELNLGYSLDKLAADTYGKNYSDERKLQSSAAKDLGTLGQGQQKLQGSLLDASGNQYGDLAKQQTTAANDLTTSQNTAASTLQTGYDTGNKNTLSALGLYPATQKQTFYPATQEIEAGKGAISSPYYNLSQYMGLLPTGYGSSTTGSKTDPIYGPSALSTGTSLLGTLAKGASLL